jgi:hypothetical protein
MAQNLVRQSRSLTKQEVTSLTASEAMLARELDLAVQNSVDGPQRVSDELSREWFDEFDGASAEDLKQAFKRFRRKSKFFPKISEISDELRLIEAGRRGTYRGYCGRGCNSEGWLIKVSESTGRDIWQRCQCWIDYRERYGIEAHEEDNRETRRRADD